jgi:methylenetetrahydrofolate reductase (NADPH)
MEGLEGDAAKDEGVRIAAELIARLRELPGVDGVHLMAPGWETEAVPRVVEAAGLDQGAMAPPEDVSAPGRLSR